MMMMMMEKMKERNIPEEAAKSKTSTCGGKTEETTYKVVRGIQVRA
jgi:hypothetical protein